MKTYWKKFKAFWKELGNLVTNVACPLLSIVAAILEIFNAPASWIQGVKKAEHWCWNLYGTKEDIDKIVDGIDNAIGLLGSVDKQEEVKEEAKEEEVDK